MTAFFNYFKSLPLQLIVSICTAFMLGSLLSPSIVSFFYTASTCFIELLMFALPLMVFTLIFSAISKTKQKSLQLILLIFGGVFLSNSLALYTAYFFSSLTLPSLGITESAGLLTRMHASIEPLFRLHLPTLLSTDKAMLLAFIAGLLISRLPETNRLRASLHQSILSLSKAITFILNRIFIPLLPLYVFGFCLKLSHEQTLPHLFSSYGKVFILSMLLVIAYIFGLFLLGAGGRLKLAWSHLKTMAPAGLTGFSTMSSAATMPVTLKCTEITTQDKQFAGLLIPSTSNIHMLGDDLMIVVAAMALLPMFGLPTPDLPTFAWFAAAFCIAKLSCVGIPGASVLVVLPVLQSYLNFSPEMITVLTTIYILQDSFGTAANVLGNGAFALIIQRFFKKAYGSDALEYGRDPVS